MRIAATEFAGLPLEVHALLADVPLRDVTAIDLPGGGPGRTLAEVPGVNEERTDEGSWPVRVLFGLRIALGRLFGWDRPELNPLAHSFLKRVPEALRARSLRPPGAPVGFFRLLYQLPNEMLLEARNATVHAFLASALVAIPGGYRLYWAVYVQKVSWLTPLYMAAIEPFRRFVVYPSILRRLRRQWLARYA